MIRQGPYQDISPLPSQDEDEKPSAGHESSSLDFERIVNSYSIQVTKARVIKTAKQTPQQAKKPDRGGHHRRDDSLADLINNDNARLKDGTLDNPFLTPRTSKSRRPKVTINDDAVVHEGEAAAFDETHPLLTKKDRSSLPGIISKNVKKTRQLKLRYSGEDATTWMFTCLTGILIGVLAVVIVACVNKIVAVRSIRLNQNMVYLNPSFALNQPVTWSLRMESIFINFVVFNLLLSMLCSIITVFRAPSGAGSGIPEVKAYLNGVRVAKFERLDLLVVKVVGTILSVSSGLCVGPEGPLVHIGAVVGSSVTKTGKIELWIRKFRRKHPIMSGLFGCASDTSELLNVLEKESNERLDNDGSGPRMTASRWWHKLAWRNSVISQTLNYSSKFRNDAQRRDFISIGSAAGFAAAFGAPVGGVLYSLEEASSFFANTLLWKTLTATAIATFCIAVYHGDLTRYSVLKLRLGKKDEAETVLLRFAEIPFYLLIGLGGGLLGAFFNSSCMYLSKQRSRLQKQLNDGAFAIAKLAEVAMLSIATSTILFWVSVRASWACKKVTEHNSEDMANSQYNCAAGEYNELGNIMLASRDEGIVTILEDPGAFHPNSLFLVGFIFYVLMIFTNGVAIPSGLFMPTCLIGSSLGGFAGVWLKENVNQNLSPSDFALLGAAALLGGIQRSTVSLCVILMEGTGQTKILIPVIVTIVVATHIGDLFNHGLSELVIEAKHYPYLEHHVKSAYDMFRVRDIMSSPVVTVGAYEVAGELERLLMETQFNGFPVVEKSSGKFLGLVRRDQLCALLECRVFTKSRGSEDDTTNRATGAEFFGVDSRSSLMASGLLADLTRQLRGDDKALGLSVIQSDLLSPSDIRRNSAVIPMALHIRDDRYESDFSGKDKGCWDMCQDDSKKDIGQHDWFADNVMISQRNPMALFSDDTVPKFGEIGDEEGTIVSVVNGNLVCLLAEEDRSKRVYIEAVMNRGAFSITSGVPVSKAYEMFTQLGLRHLCVLGGSGEVVGMITRSNLIAEHLEKTTGYKL